MVSSTEGHTKVLLLFTQTEILVHEPGNALRAMLEHDSCYIIGLLVLGLGKKVAVRPKLEKRSINWEAGHLIRLLSLEAFSVANASKSLVAIP